MSNRRSKTPATKRNFSMTSPAKVETINEYNRNLPIEKLRTTRAFSRSSSANKLKKYTLVPVRERVTIVSPNPSLLFTKLKPRTPSRTKLDPAVESSIAKAREFAAKMNKPFNFAKPKAEVKQIPVIMKPAEEQRGT